jgi:hypothetical protein
LNFNFFYDKKAGFFLKLGPRAARCCPRAGPGSPTFKFAGTGGHGPQFFKITGGHGQRAAKCHGLLTSSLESGLTLQPPVRLLVFSLGGCVKGRVYCIALALSAA